MTPLTTRAVSSSNIASDSSKVARTFSSLPFLREYLLVLKYKMCSSFPITQIVQFHKEKERVAESKEIQALVTLMAARLPPEYAKNYGSIVQNPKTNELLHYAENKEHHVSDLINCGIFLLSNRFFEEFGGP